jgi:hypothetical protein
MSLDDYLTILVLFLVHRDLAFFENRLVLTTAFETADVRFTLLEARWGLTFCSAIRRTLDV